MGRLSTPAAEAPRKASLCGCQSMTVIPHTLGPSPQPSPGNAPPDANIRGTGMGGLHLQPSLSGQVRMPVLRWPEARGRVTAASISVLEPHCIVFCERGA